MTLSVKVSVPEKADYVAHVFALDHRPGNSRVYEALIAIVKPGESYDYAVYQGRDILVKEARS